MSWREEEAARLAAQERAVVAALEAVPLEVRGHVRKALRWARERLMRREGAGHGFALVRDRRGIVCAFAKPQWSGDHCGTPQRTGAEAVVRSVLEYEAGM